MQGHHGRASRGRATQGPRRARTESSALGERAWSRAERARKGARPRHRAMAAPRPRAGAAPRAPNGAEGRAGAGTPRPRSERAGEPRLGWLRRELCRGEKRERATPRHGREQACRAARGLGEGRARGGGGPRHAGRRGRAEPAARQEEERGVGDEVEGASSPRGRR
jgi:hypothetical protein